MKEFFKSLYRFLTNRLLWLSVILVALFYVLAARLFELQIVLSDTFKLAAPRTQEVSVPIAPLRGSIYDRNGRPLAINTLAYTVKMDPSVSITNEALYELVKVFERNGESYVDSFPMTYEEPYAFTWADGEWREWLEYRWKDDMTVPDPHNATAPETFAYLREQFGIDPEISDAEARKILNFRCMIYRERLIVLENYNPTPITLAYDIKPETVAAIEENNYLFKGISIDIEPLREYPQGIYFSHMLGYIRQISETELEANQDKGYTSQDLIGKAGLERSMESYLRGTAGSQTIEVDAAGRRIEVVSTTDALAGDRIFLTLDADLQQKAYHVLEDMLAQVLIDKIKSNGTREKPITLKQIFVSLIESNHIPLKKVLEAPEGGDAYALRKYILERFPDAGATKEEDIDRIKTLLTDGIEAGRITSAMMLLAMIDLGILSDPDGYLPARIKSGVISPQQVVIDKITAKELTPQMLNLDPCSGSVVITDVSNGDVWVAASYPSYDNNRFVNNFDNEYYTKINQNDPTTPMVYRPFMEARAPGSTFKMVTAAAALEAGVITPSRTVLDEYTFTKAGLPYTKCWSATSHGHVNVSQALQVSCNYFFCEAAYRLGNTKSGTKMTGIEILNSFMIFFGLNDKTGVEIGEYYNIYDHVPDLLKVSSPAFKEYTEKNRDAYVTKADWDWYDGDTVKTAIGQGLNNYTPAMMAKMVSVIANRGIRYPLHLVDSIEDSRGNTVMDYVAIPEETELTVSDSTWDTIIEGMRLVTEGTGGRLTGTGVSEFEDFPIRVAGKTGTAQQSTLRNDHSSFAGFAPLENPEIAIYVSIPFGDSKTTPRIAAKVARVMIGEVLGVNVEPELPEAVNQLRP